MAYSFVWPPTLPSRPLQDGFDFPLGVNSISTPMDKGPVKRRVRGLRAGQKSISLLLTSEQYEALKNFVLSTLGNGMARFGFPDVLTGDVEEVTFMPDDNGNILRPVPTGYRMWTVSFTLEVHP